MSPTRLDDTEHVRLQTLERVSCALSHEINNMLTVVLAHASLLQLDAADPDAARHSSAIERAASRAATLAADLRELTGCTGPRVRPFVDLGEVVASLPPALGAMLGAAWVLTANDDAGRHVAMERARLEQAAVLMASAARSRFPSGGRASLASGPASGPPGLALLRFEASPAPSLVPSRLPPVDDPTRLELLHRLFERNGGRLSVVATADRLVIEATIPEDRPNSGEATSGST